MAPHASPAYSIPYCPVHLARLAAHVLAVACLRAPPCRHLVPPICLRVARGVVWLRRRSELRACWPVVLAESPGARHSAILADSRAVPGDSLERVSPPAFQLLLDWVQHVSVPLSFVHEAALPESGVQTVVLFVRNVQSLPHFRKADFSAPLNDLELPPAAHASQQAALRLATE
jgi:hypothetical protein